MLNEIQERLSNKETFAIETTLAIKSYFNLIKQARLLGYETVLYFFYLPSAAMAKERVKLRVSKGGHTIPPEVIERRYKTGLKNFFEYIVLVDRWRMYKNDITPPELIAEGEMESVAKIYNFDLWERLRKE